ncbi:MAG: Mercuric reductase [Chroococcopsis gigantea SAG 12.99]|jgi:pyruvate/2-oxoglutarate dehydrogenase complex dihydrolipoamide dehydrogenase (E3) component|nr:Mercuric reductase [Chroococcopsis gigantea SAG 12.99]
MAVEYDLVIIGGGSAGLVVASAAAQLKAKVALVEKDRLGGDCLWAGCVPSKSLLEAGRVAHTVKNSVDYAVHSQLLTIDFKGVIDRVRGVIETIEPHDSQSRFRNLGVEVIEGQGKFIDPKTFAVGGKKLTARAFVVATGSRPLIPPIIDIETVGYVTNEQIFSLKQRPKCMVIVGGGPIACELGQALHRLGVSITILVRGDHLLPKEDPEISAIIEHQFEAEGIGVMTRSNVRRVEKFGSRKHIWLEDERLITDEVLIATGRLPNVESLGLEAAKVKYDEAGVKVNSKLQTSNSKIYACGDVIGGYKYTHVAGYEASIVVQNALFFPNKNVDYRVIPRAIFTQPEIAIVGLSEAEARQKHGDKVFILKQDFTEVDRAQAAGKTEGFAKIICLNNGQILGANLIGESAGELIHEIILAMRYRLPVSALSGIHVYPTLSEVNSKAALLLNKHKYAQNLNLQKNLKGLFQFLRSL